MEPRRQSETFRRRLVQRLERDGVIRSARVRDAFAAVPRELFLADFAEQAGLEAVYEDEAIVTRKDAQGLPLSSSSQPAIMALMLEELDVEPGMSVLEVGAGTGYNAALLSVLVGPRGRVVSVDLDADTAAGADRGLHAGGYRAQVVTRDGRDGFSDGAPYDRIVVTASSDSVPFAWFEQLKPGGLLELPFRASASGVQVIPVLRKDDGGFRSKAVLGGGFMPLRRAGENAAASVPPALRVAEVTGGEARPVRELYGLSLATLAPRAKRRLLSVALEDGRRQPLGLRGGSRALALFLALTLPEQRSVSTMPTFGVGAITRDGSSLAVLELGRRCKAVDSFRLFGSDDAAKLLLRSVREWDRRGRPDESDLAISVRYDDEGRPRVRRRWRNQ
jgi:protein-L-isoaspartate(D-aspartate) O-methyltransferase